MGFSVNCMTFSNLSIVRRDSVGEPNPQTRQLNINSLKLFVESLKNDLMEYGVTHDINFSLLMKLI